MNNIKKSIILARNMGMGILNKIEKNNYSFNCNNNLTKYEKLKIVFKSLNIIDILLLFYRYIIYNL